MDSLAQRPDLLKAILALPPHEVFILASASEIFASEITNTRILPLTGDDATKYAQNVLKSQHIQDAVTRQMTNIVSRANQSVRVAKEYEPPKTPAAKPQKREPD